MRTLLKELHLEEGLKLAAMFIIGVMAMSILNGFFGQDGDRQQPKSADPIAELIEEANGF